MLTITECFRLASFEERFEYLYLGDGEVAKPKFGSERARNQQFYGSTAWRRVRDSVILRDAGCDLGVRDRPIVGRIIVHHINPAERLDFTGDLATLLNAEYLVSTSEETHRAIHYGTSFDTPLVERRPNDTSPWRPQ